MLATHAVSPLLMLSICFSFIHLCSVTALSLLVDREPEDTRSVVGIHPRWNADPLHAIFHTHIYTFIHI